MAELNTTEMARAEALAAEIKAKASAVLGPLRSEMDVMKWAPELRVIMWKAVAREVLGEVDRAGRQAGLANDRRNSRSP